MSQRVELIGISGMPEIAPGVDLAELIVEACRRDGLELSDSDVIVVTQKIVSKAEGCIVALDTVQPSHLAEAFARAHDKDPRLVELALREARRIVRMDRGVLITETHHGFVCANSGVDASNVGSAEAATTLPKDPDRTAANLKHELDNATGARVAVVLSDTFGRPWREGVANVAIGVAGLEPLTDYRGRADADGRSLSSTVIAVADEIAAAAELVMGKLDRIPVAIVRGYRYTPGDSGAAPLIRDETRDLFR